MLMEMAINPSTCNSQTCVFQRLAEGRAVCGCLAASLTWDSCDDEPLCTGSVTALVYRCIFIATILSPFNLNCSLQILPYVSYAYRHVFIFFKLQMKTLFSSFFSLTLSQNSISEHLALYFFMSAQFVLQYKYTIKASPLLWASQFSQYFTFTYNITRTEYTQAFTIEIFYNITIERFYKQNCCIKDWCM